MKEVGCKLRIGVVAPEFPPALGGMETYAFEVAKQLAARGHDVVVFTKAHQGTARYREFLVYPILRGHSDQDWQSLRQFAGAVDVWHVMNAAYAWLALRVENVVLSVYGNDFINPNPVVRWDLKRRFRLPKGDRVDLMVAKWRTRSVLSKALVRVDHVIAISNFTKQLLERVFPQCQGKTTVACAGVSDSFFQVHRPQARSAQPQLTTVCRLSERRKNVDVTLRALARLKDRHDFHYHIIGDGPLRAGLQASTQTLGLSDRVTFHGFVESEELKQRLAYSDLFILTSSLHPDTVEGLGIVYLEANACGTPTLAARLGGAVEAVEEDVSGMFVDQPDETSVAKQLDRFLSGQITFTKDQCQDFARRFRWTNAVDQMLKCYPMPLRTILA